MTEFPHDNQQPPVNAPSADALKTCQPTIVVVGGVAGGASAVARARRMHESAKIILLEKDDDISFANCGLPYYLGGEITDRNKLLVAKPQRFREWLNVEVRTQNLAQAIHPQQRTITVLDRKTGQRYQQPYDRLILSPGADPVMPKVPGYDLKNIFTLRNLADTDRIKNAIGPGNGKGRHAVVIGAGFIGLEMVEMLHLLGFQVTLVEKNQQVLPPLDVEMAKMIETELIRHNVQVRLGTTATSFEGNSKVEQIKLADGSTIPADLVIVGVGVQPNTQLAQSASLAVGPTGGIIVNQFMQTSDPNIYAVGDAVEYHHAPSNSHRRIPLAGPANRAGRIAGEHAALSLLKAESSDNKTTPQPTIASIQKTNLPQPAAMPSVLGTAIVRVFSLTAALTGLSEKTLSRHPHIRGKTILITANSHAGYYPNARELTLKLLYEVDSGKILGAQIVGGDGVDKRLDVIATAMHFGATVHQLTELDLAYAPPFSSAKDPVHLAGFAAQNEIRGLVSFVSPAKLQDLENNVQILDVRTPQEWTAGRLAQAKHIPLSELRGRLQELDPTRPVVTVCRGGQRAYYAARILSQN